uniref:Predicted protein n=1 Tax=Hordeum vulgare subsp. vulgare TaxID=112509 RepID=F2DU21_HORVV|nr:predicted protein [Hordeum vulgare subsp. vulgare]
MDIPVGLQLVSYPVRCWISLSLVNSIVIVICSHVLLISMF